MCSNDLRSRAWCFTWNNYPPDAIDRLRAISCERMVVGREVGESGTPHLQGYVRFKNARTFSYWKKGWPQVHVEPRKGTETQAAEYCKKGGDVAIEFGVNYDEKLDTKGMSRHDEALMIREEARLGATFGQISQRHPAFVFFNRTATINAINDERYFMSKGRQDDGYIKWDEHYKNHSVPL